MSNSKSYYLLSLYKSTRGNKSMKSSRSSSGIKDQLLPTMTSDPRNRRVKDFFSFRGKERKVRVTKGGRGF